MAQTIFLEASFPLAQFEANIRKKQLENKFTFLYALPQAAKAFSLHEQYAKIRGTPLDKDKPWLVIDNIPNGAMNEKFLFSGNVPGMTAADLMKMITQYLDYKLPLLVRSAPTPGFSIMTGDSRGRRMRGASSISHTVDVVSDTFQEIVLNTTHTCFLLHIFAKLSREPQRVPILDRVALRIKDLKNVTIAKMDLTKNDLPIRDIIVHHYPTAYLFPAGDGGDTVSITKGSNLFPVTFKKA